jgi:hypothetical protein
MAIRAAKPHAAPAVERRTGVSNPPCPICDGRMETVYDRHHQKVSVCVDCHTGISVPGTAWEIARIKRDTKWMPKP